MRAKYLLLAMFCALSGYAQLPATPSEVGVYISDSLCMMARVTTQTEQRRGIEIAGFSTSNKQVKYLWKQHSGQLCDNPLPLLVIDPQKCTLADFAIMQLKIKKNYRQLPKSVLRENDYLPVNLQNFDIKLNNDDSFLIQPKQALKPGEYIILNINQQATGEYGDYTGYCFTIL